ncbi:hypothetical protein TNCV_3095011 [Trichonephila clavipes]|nr:hypothetical protein TNCV_3095011 [Trichonephila clavipes]
MIAALRHNDILLKQDEKQTELDRRMMEYCATSTRKINVNYIPFLLLRTKPGATRGLLPTDLGFLNHAQATKSTPELASTSFRTSITHQWEDCYWARTHDMPAMIRYLDHWATAAHVKSVDAPPVGLLWKIEEGYHLRRHPNQLTVV